MSDIAFIRREIAPMEPPPMVIGGPVGWVRKNLFSGWFNITLTAVSVVLIALIVPPLLKFYIFDAVWTGDNRESCLVASGACWPFVKAKFGQFVYGFYPIAERWRPNLVFAFGAILLAGLLIPRAPFKRWNAILFFGVFPIAALILLGGGDFSLNQFIIGRIVPLAAMLHGVQIFGLTLSFWLDFVVSSALIVVATYFIANALGAEGGFTARAAATLLIGIGAVLLALDFDEASTSAGRAALDMGIFEHTDVIVMHAFEAPFEGTLRRWPDSTGAADDYVAGEHSLAVDKLYDLVRELGLPAKGQRVVGVNGTPARSILESARSEDSHLIVMGTNQRKGWERLLIGSVTEDVIRDPHRDVLMIPIDQA